MASAPVAESPSGAAPDGDLPRASGPLRSGPLRRIGETCLWLLVIGGTVYAGFRIGAFLKLVVLPVLLALVLTALLEPPARWLRRHGWRRAPAGLAVMLAALAVIVGIGFWLVPSVGGEVGDLQQRLTAGLDKVERWLVDGPLSLSDKQIGGAVDRITDWIRGNLSSLAGGVVAGATVLLQLLAGLLLAVVVLFFFIKDGDRMWAWTQTLVPRRHREDVRGAGERAYSALSSFLRAQSLVALFDATFIGLALFIIGVPLALPLTVLTFMAAYVPYIGAISAGAAAVLVALVDQGVGTALIVLAAVIVVQQFEGHVIEPLIMGRALSVHPLIIVLGVTAGGIIGGLIGSIIATPVLAAASGVFAHFRERYAGDPP